MGSFLVYIIKWQVSIYFSILKDLPQNKSDVLEKRPTQVGTALQAVRRIAFSYLATSLRISRTFGRNAPTCSLDNKANVAASFDARHSYLRSVLHLGVEPEVFFQIVPGDMVSPHR